jgi:signal transduction histidine kinase
MIQRFTTRTGSLDRSIWLFALLLLLMLLPAAFVLWFMNEAIASQSETARRSVREAYRGQLRLVRSRVDAHWQTHAARLNAAGDPDRRFAQLVLEQMVDGVVLLNADGSVAFPDPATRTTAAGGKIAAEIERLSGLAANSRARSEATERVAARLNDYATALPASERLALMERLRSQEPNVAMPTEAALRLSLALAGPRRPTPPVGHFLPTPIRDVWAFTSADGRAVALYWTGRLESMMHDLLHQVTPAGIRFIAFPPDVEGDPEAIAAGPSLPGWQLTFQPLDRATFDDAVRRRAMVYVAAGAAGIAVIALLGAIVARAFRRHLYLARLKTDLVAAVSHELRTPLASMRVLVEGLLADDELDPTKTREYLGLLATENSRLTRVVENFLTFSRLERGRQHFTFTAAHPSTLVSSALDAVRERMPVDCDLRVDIAPDLPPVIADTEALVTALVNLLDNALKYTPADKRILIRVHADAGGSLSSGTPPRRSSGSSGTPPRRSSGSSASPGSPASPGRRCSVVFAVGDNGIGIAAREQRRIFRRFYRVDQRLTRETGGVGLGLSIVELIVRAHGGSVGVSSEAGRGSTFTLRLPAASEGAAA